MAARIKASKLNSYKEMLKACWPKEGKSLINYDFKTMKFLLAHYSDWAVIPEKELSQQENIF